MLFGFAEIKILFLLTLFMERTELKNENGGLGGGSAPPVG